MLRDCSQENGGIPSCGARENASHHGGSETLRWCGTSGMGWVIQGMEAEKSTQSEPLDVPSPIDLQREVDAKAWAESANRLRPWRNQFFEAVSAAIPSDRAARILELGSGPGFLAEHILRSHPAARMVLLDLSEPMHTLAIERLKPFAGRVSYVCRSFKGEDWTDGLGTFDYIVTNQAVHELRHKRYAESLHRSVRSILNVNGLYLVSDHFCGEGGMKNDALYMTVEEQRQALLAAGFEEVCELLCLGGMVMHGAV